MASSKKNTAVRGSDDDGGNGEAMLSQDDLEWLSSLSEPELDFLISLKELAIRRAKNAGYKVLANKFDVKMLRALGIVLLEHFKSHAESASLPPNFAEKSALLRDCNLTTPHIEKNAGFVIVSEDAKEPRFVTPRRKRMWEGLCEKGASSSKKKENSKKTKTARKLM